MRFCNFIRRIKNRTLEKHVCSESDRLIIFLFCIFPLMAIIFVNMVSSLQLITNHIVYASTHNLTNGCPLTNNQCSKEFKRDSNCWGIDAIIMMFWDHPIDMNRGLCCFGPISWLNISRYCIRSGFINIISLFLICIIGGVPLFVCWIILRHMCICFHDATKIYEEETRLESVKVN